MANFKGVIIAALLAAAYCLTACNPGDEVSMSARYQLLIPEATTNLIRNPSAEMNLTDWTAQGSAIERSSEAARFGSYSVKVTTNGATDHEGANVRAFPNTSGQIYAGSVYVRGAGRVRVRIRDNANGDEFVTDAFSLSTRRWTNITDLIGRTGAIVSDDLRLHVETVGVQSVTFYVDGGQIEPKAYSTTYIDGEQAGGQWLGTYHASTSTRQASERSGGYFVDLDEGGIGVYATQTSGEGMPPIRLNLQDRALMSGLEFQSTKIQGRDIIITLHARSNRMADLKILQEKRQELINAIKPDLVEPTQPFTLRYTGGAFPVDINVYYSSGLEFEGDIRNPHTNNFSIRLLAANPFWREDDQESESLDFIASINPASHAFRYHRGEYQVWGDFSNPIEWMAEAPNGRIYVAGNFTSINGDARMRQVAYWDGEDWYPLTNGLNGTAHGITVAADGTVYACGTFTGEQGGGVAMSYIGQWNPVTETWSPVGAGFNGTCYSVAIHPTTGDLYAAGSFDDLQGGIGNTLNRLARWDGANWHTMGGGPGLFDGGAGGLAITKDGSTIYFSGSFTLEFGTMQTLDRIAQYDVATDTITDMNGGANNGVGDTKISPVNGDLYVVGDFTTIGGVSANHIARWNGIAFFPLGDGLDDNAYRVNPLDDGDVLVGGIFRQAGDLDLADGFAVWNGTAWIRYPVDIPNIAGGAPGRVMNTIKRKSTIYFGGAFGWPAGGLQTVLTAAPNTVDNIGTREAKPVFEIRGPGVVQWIENVTTGQRIYIDYLLHTSEILIIDTATYSATSNWSGNALGSILPESEIAEFVLSPGENDLLVYVSDGDENTEVIIRFVPLHWSFDGAIN